MTAHVPASRRLNGPYAVLPLFLSALLLVAFVVVPPLLMPVARGGDLAMRAHELVTAWVARGGAGPPAALREFLDGWRDYHLLKAALAAAAAVAIRFMNIRSSLVGRSVRQLQQHLLSPFMWRKDF